MKVKTLFLTTCLLLLVTPIEAQTSTPPPPVTNGQMQQLLNAMQQFVSQQAASDTTTVNTSVILFGVGFIFIIVLLLIAIQRLGKPLFDTLKNSQDTIRRLEGQIDERQRDYQKMRADYDELYKRHQSEDTEFRGRDLEVKERTVNLLKTLPTRAELDKSSEETRKNSDKNTAAINQHTTEQTKLMLDKQEEIIGTIAGLETKVDALATKDDMAKELKPIRDDISALRKLVEQQLVKPITPTNSAIPQIPGETGVE